MSNRTRREWLRVVGAAGVVGIAGCSSSEETGTNDEETEPDGEETEPDGGETEPDGEETPTETEPPVQNLTQQAKIAPDDGDSDDQFGVSVTLSGDGSIALIGASQDEDPNGYAAGSAYVHDSSGGSWTQQTKLAPDGSDRRDYFGQSVALSSDGSTALIGAINDNDPHGFQYKGGGSVYVFDSSGGSWTQQAKLAPDDGDSDDQFGYSMALSSDSSTALIGATGDEDPNGDGAGSAYVFE